MSYTVITKPAVGDPTRLDTFAIPVVNDLDFLNNGLQNTMLIGINNGSFESPLGAPYVPGGDGVDIAPTGWILSLSNAAHSNIENTPANVMHGAQSFATYAASTPGGSAVLTTQDFYPIGELQSLTFSWFMMAAHAQIESKVFVLFYDETQALLSTVTLYDTAHSGPTAWTSVAKAVGAPTTARFFKLQFASYNCAAPAIGGTWWDGFTYRATQANPVPGAWVFGTAGDNSWEVPANTNVIFVKMLAGGGGGGGGGESNSGSGGGAGGGSGSAGGDSYFESTAYKARGGAGGIGGCGGVGGYGGGAGGAATSASMTSASLLWGNGAGSAGTSGGPGVPGSRGAGCSGGDKIFSGNYGGGGVGGDGGGDNGYTGGGGGGGGANGEYVEMTVPVTPGSTINIRVGAAGGCGAGGTGNAGGDGQNGNWGQQGLVVISF